MKTAIIFYSKHGTTGKVAKLIGEKFNSEVEYISLDSNKNPDITDYNRIIRCMNEKQEIEELKNAYPDYLHSLKIPEAVLGGEFQFEKMSFFEKFITKKVSKIEQSVSKIRYDAITEFAEKINGKHTHTT